MSLPADSMPEVLTRGSERLKSAHRSAQSRHRRERIFRNLCLSVTILSVVLLVVFLAAIFYQGYANLSWRFLSSPPGPDPAEAGFHPAIFGTIWLLVLVAVTALPLGVATAIMLEEFKPRSRQCRNLLHFVQANITNLAGVPSVVYGIVGLTAFVGMFQLFGNPLTPDFEMGIRYYDQFYNEADQILLLPVENGDAPYAEPVDGMRALNVDHKPVNVHVIGFDDPWPEDPELAARTLRDTDMAGRINEQRWFYFRIPFGRGVLAGALTLMLVILPVVIISSQEALRAVPNSLREAALGLGATRWQMVWSITLPAAMPGIMTGAILALSRAIGEAAPLLMIAGIVFITNPPGNLMDDFTAMPLQIFNWAQRPQSGFHEIAASGIIVLLVVLLCFNGLAIFIRQKLQKPMS